MNRLDIINGLIALMDGRKQSESDVFVGAAIRELQKLGHIEDIINMDGVQEDVMRYKMICEVMQNG